MSRREPEAVVLYRGDGSEVELPSRFAVCLSCDGRGVTTLHGIAITGDLAKVLANHAAWRKGKSGGVRAYLAGERTWTATKDGNSNSGSPVFYLE